MSELVRVAVWADQEGFFRQRALDKTLFNGSICFKNHKLYMLFEPISM